MKNFNVAIVDADSILYSCAFSLQDTVHTVGECEYSDIKEAKVESEETNTPIETVTEVLGDVNDAILCYRDFIDSIKENTGAGEVISYTGSNEGNFRKDIATIKPYKGNRKGPDPELLQPLKDFLIGSGELIRADSMLEADDQVIIEFRQLKKKLGEGKVVLCVIDKDAKQEPGHHYNFNTGEFSYLEPIDSLRHFYTQLLIGDSIDNILGLYKVGAKSTLVKHLYEIEDELEMFKFIFDEYYKRFGNYAGTFIAETFVLLYMLRSPDITEGVFKVKQLLEAISEEAD